MTQNFKSFLKLSFKNKKFLFRLLTIDRDNLNNRNTEEMCHNGILLQS